MFKLKSTVFAALTALVCASAALAQDSGPLIDLLVKKGIINDQEGEDLRAELSKDFAASSAGKMNLSSALTEMKLSGDVRVRYESRTGSLVSGDHQERDRFRYRFRTGLTGKMLNNWGWGVRLETATGSRSSNVTMGDDGGPFAKNNDTVNVGQIWAQWTPTPEFTFTAGRMPNPLVTTAMVWDADINPEGLAESFKRRVDKIEYSLTAAQFLYSAAGTQNTFGTATSTEDLFLFAWQGGIKFYPSELPTTFFQINPTIYNYGQNGPRNPAAFRGSFTATNTAAVNNLLVVDVPMEYDWVSGGIPMRVFGDFAMNVDGDDRAAKWGRADLDGEDSAWRVGFQYGKAANKGEWDFSAAYQSVGAFSLDPNLVDSDIFDSRTNMRGWVVTGNYALGAATMFTVTLGNGERKNDALIAPGAGDIGSNNALDKYWVLQADLVVKF